MKTMSKPKAAKIKDVARLAGVSPATVSRALNSPALLEAATLERVRSAAQKLHYQPLGVARSLRRRRSMVIGTIIQSMENATYISGMVEYTQRQLAQHGYTMLLSSASFDDDLAVSSCRAMIAQGIDAVMMIASRRGSKLFPLLNEFGTPHVEAWVYDPATPSIGFDHVEAMHQISRHLLDLGHRDIAVVAPIRRIADLERRRLHALEHALAAYGVDRSRLLLIDDSGFGILDGRKAMDDILARAPSTTGVICANDHLAAGVILECQARGIDVPRKISVVGYNDLEIARALSPSITTVATPYEGVASAAISYLLSSLEGSPPARMQPEKTTLLVRESTARAPRRAK
jgi:LacI family transcriptional regulator